MIARQLESWYQQRLEGAVRAIPSRPAAARIRLTTVSDVIGDGAADPADESSNAPVRDMAAVHVLLAATVAEWEADPSRGLADAFAAAAAPTMTTRQQRLTALHAIQDAGDDQAWHVRPDRPVSDLDGLTITDVRAALVDTACRYEDGLTAEVVALAMARDVLRLAGTTRHGNLAGLEPGVAGTLFYPLLDVIEGVAQRTELDRVFVHITPRFAASHSDRDVRTSGVLVATHAMVQALARASHLDPNDSELLGVVTRYTPEQTRQVWKAAADRVEAVLATQRRNLSGLARDGLPRNPGPTSVDWDRFCRRSGHGL